MQRKNSLQLVSHTYRENNISADYVANVGCKERNTSVCID